VEEIRSKREREKRGKVGGELKKVGWDGET